MNTDKITAEEMVIIDRLKQMKMSGMAEAYEEQLLNPNSDLACFFTRFSNIVNFEWELRFNKKFNRFLKKATLRYPQASFDDTEYYGAAEPPVRCGESHLSGLTEPPTLLS